MQRGQGLAADSTSTSAAHHAGARRGRTGATRRAAVGGAGPALGALVLAACATTGAPGGGDGTAPSRVTGAVRFATWASGAQAEMKQQQLDAFNQSQSGVRATLETSPDSGAYWTKLQATFAGRWWASHTRVRARRTGSLRSPARPAASRNAIS